MLKIDEVTKRFGGVLAVNCVSLEIPRGQITSLIGPNGAGKTTLINILSGIYQCDSGRILLDGHDITHKSPDKRVHIGLTRTFQNIRLFSTLSVLENVAAGFICHSEKGVPSALFEPRRHRRELERINDSAEQLLAWLGIRKYKDHLPAELSYGIRRRVEIVRALATKPKLLMLDEPTAGLMAGEAQELVNIMRELVDEGITLLLIEHNMKVVASVSDQIVVVNFGEKIAAGHPQEVLYDPSVIEAYIGTED
jgi:ABC-type branched-subunit amino acid transport system ATPase component